MAMAKLTRMELDKAHVLFGDREFTEEEWKRTGLRLTLHTACYYEVEELKHTKRCYYTVQELVDELNSCAGDDCYACDWFYQVDEQGRAFRDFHTYTYRMRARG